MGPQSPARGATIARSRGHNCQFVIKATAAGTVTYMSSRSIAGASVLAIVLSCLTATSSEAQAVIICAGHEATIVGTAGDDTLTGTDGPDVIAALEGDDHVDGSQVTTWSAEATATTSSAVRTAMT